jgi:hypothetical protein
MGSGFAEMVEEIDRNLFFSSFRRAAGAGEGDAPYQRHAAGASQAARSSTT